VVLARAHIQVSRVRLASRLAIRTADTTSVESIQTHDETADVRRRITCALPLVRLNLPKDDLRKINQYLDATRASTLFARSIILVEGIAEAVLLPVLARRCVFPGSDNLAKRRKFNAVTIINVGSVDFAPYIRLLLTVIDGISVMDHLVVITDTDPDIKGGASNGAGSDDDEEADDAKAANRPDDLVNLARELGGESRLTVAAASYTLEADLLGEKQNAAVLREAYRCQHPRSKQWEQVETADDPAKALYLRLGEKKKKKLISKGEFAHDVALLVQDGQPFTAPAYLREAITSAIEEPGESSAATVAQ
jgi:putative ATP-dependent endonuclease of OLD family